MAVCKREEGVEGNCGCWKCEKRAELQSEVKQLQAEIAELEREDEPEEEEVSYEEAIDLLHSATQWLGNGEVEKAILRIDVALEALGREVEAIPWDDQEDVMDVYWEMLMCIESRTKPEKDVLNTLTVEGAYKLLNRIKYLGRENYGPRWEK